MSNKNAFRAMLLAFFLVAILIVANVRLVSGYTPHKGDYFNYSETITVNNGGGSYSGYSDQTQVTGMEQTNSVNGSIVSASYSYSYQYSNSQGVSSSTSMAGDYTWSSNNFTYVNGTDNQVGYAKPIGVWFAINTSLPVGASFAVLNTGFIVLSKNYSLQLPTEGKYVQTIRAEGTGEYQRDDSYGVFNASYTWYEYFDPSTGYIVGYNYVEQDNGQYQGQAGSFTYTDNLYVTSTSYALTIGSAPPSSSSTTTTSASSSATTAASGFLGLGPYFGYIILLVAILFIVVIAVYIATRTRRRRDTSLPKHSPYTPPPTPPSTPPSTATPSESKIDLGSQPSQQVVIRDVAMVNCKYCGTLIPSTASVCPRCGAPRQ